MINKREWIILLFFIILFSCKKEDKFDYPLVFTGDVINITDSSATFVAKINNLGSSLITESGFIWDLYPSYKNGFNVKNDLTREGVYELQTNLKLLPGKTYYARPYVQSESVISYGKEITFTSRYRQIDLGIWTQVYNDNLGYGSCEFINSSFSLDSTCYLAFQDGTLYSYNYFNKKFSLVLTDAILSKAYVSLVFNDTVYIFSGNTIYSLDLKTKSFVKKNNITESIYGASGFLIADNIYIGLGSGLSVYSKKFWKYNITNNIITEITSFPGSFRSDAFSFSLNNKGYIGGGFNLIEGQWPYPKFHDLWCYDPETNKWMEKEQLQINIEDIYRLKGANTGENGYCFFNNRLFEYNTTYDTWQEMAKLNINYQLCYPHFFSWKNKLIVINVLNYDGKKYFKMWSYEK